MGRGVGVGGGGRPVAAASDDIDALLSLTAGGDGGGGGGSRAAAGSSLPRGPSFGVAGGRGVGSVAGAGLLTPTSSFSAAGGGGGDGGGIVGGAAADKCRAVCVGGATAELGGTRTGLPPRACSSLRCTSCDFAVERWPSISGGGGGGGVKWSAGVDYMFFRNNMPNRSKLEVKLERYQGAAAYCCQCSWVSVVPMQQQQGGGVVQIRRAATAQTSAAAAADAARLGLALEAGGNGWAYWTCGGGH